MFFGEHMWVLRISLPFLCLACAFPASRFDLPVVVSRTGPVATGTFALRNLEPDAQYSMLYSIRTLSGLTAASRVNVDIRQGTKSIASKVLHVGDTDFYTQFRVPVKGSAQVVISAT